MIRAITVTAEDIAAGARRNCFYCPVARAIARALDLPVGDVDVSHHHVTVYRKVSDDFETARLPEPADLFVRDFDAVEATGTDRPLLPLDCFAPFAFDLDVPEGFGQGGGL